ncbi:MAG: FHA domain-containing protein [Bacteroidales bacterium]|jgi:pSer/pThr/pTyr-binding forkhead associated (FHA) protein|nr:FHA domain-containing protein [Bacteroidales bacterium]
MKVITIGRGNDNDVVINDITASSRHLQIIQHDDGHFSLVDLDSSNGTFVNGQKISGEKTLDPYDFVRIGNTIIPWKKFFDPKKTTVNNDISAPAYHKPEDEKPIESNDIGTPDFNNRTTEKMSSKSDNRTPAEAKEQPTPPPPPATAPAPTTKATLKVIRKRRLKGCAVSFSAWVDEKKIGSLNNGTTLTCELEKGQHILKIISFEKDISQVINITDGCKGVEVNVSIGIGVLVGRPRFKEVKYF